MSGDCRPNYLELTGKVALVTGASSGIGAATAQVLASLGARVAIGYYANKKGAANARETVVAAGGEAVVVKADVRRPDQCRAMVGRVSDELGAIDILVNNAGSLVKRRPLCEVTEREWDEIMDLNLKSAMVCCQAVAPAMIQRKGGAIVNVVSIAGRSGGGPGAGAYSTAKGGLITFTKALAKELAPQGVRVNAVSPGVIDTPFHEEFSTPEMIQSIVKTIALGRVGTAFECAKVIAFLVSEAASYVVGETIEVNGGQLML
jgi:3-oxoacyl-[acyl-carrier protein] reductase